MLTERTKIAIFFLVLSLLLALYTQVELIFLITAILVSILAVSFLLFKITRITDIKCRRQMPNAVYEGQNVEVRLSLENKSRFTSYFFGITDNFSAELSNKQEKKLVFAHLGQKAVLENVYEGNCPKRGVYWIGPLILTASDPLGFFKKSTVINITSKLTVYPKIFGVNELGSFNKGVVPPRYGSHATRKSGDYEEFFGIREYHQEDGLRKIHWVSSARHNQLMVRHFEQTGAHSATIVLDLKYGNNIGVESETTLEYAVRSAASLTKYFLDQGFMVQLLAYADKPIITSFGKDPSHFSQILELLAQVEANSSFSLSEALNKLHHFIYPNSTLVVLRLDSDADSARTIEQLIYTKNISVFDIQLVTSSFDSKLPPTSTSLLDVKGSEVLTYQICRGDNLEYKFVRR